MLQWKPEITGKYHGSSCSSPLPFAATDVLFSFWIKLHAKRKLHNVLPSLIVIFVPGVSGKTLRDFLEALPREWISEDLMEALVNSGVYLSPTM